MNSKTLNVLFPRDLNLFLFLLSVVLGLEMFLIRGNIGLNLADEGFLWCGVDRVFHGEVPVLDFRSYDPARYYWSALWFWIWRPGLLPLRFSETILQVIGLFFALLSAKRYTENRWELSGLGFVLTLWMYPCYRYIEMIVPMIAVYLGFKVLENPKKLICLIAGLFVGLAAFIQRQHGIYLGFSFFALILFALWNQEKLKGKLLIFFMGILIGISPLLFMFAFIKGFFQSYLDHMVLVYLWFRSTNLTLSVPWPWKIHWIHGQDLLSLSHFISGTLFLVIPLFYIYCIFGFFAKKGSRYPAENLTFSCALIGCFYLHHAYSRADFEHLTACVAPFWIAVCSIAAHSPIYRRLLLISSLLITLLSAAIESNLVNCLDPTKVWPVECSINGDNFELDMGTAITIENMKWVVNNLRAGETVLLAPNLSSLYPVFQLKPPTWELYTTLPMPPSYQQRSIQELEKNNTQWVVIDNSPVDGREDLRFTKSQTILWNYIKAHFARAVGTPYPWNLALFRRMDGSPDGR